MAHVEDRWEKVVDGKRTRTARFGLGSRWRARYRAPDGQERSQTFARKVDAERWLAGVEGDKARGRYIDPTSGRQRFGRYATEWASRQQHRPSTQVLIQSQLRNHLLPAFGHRELAQISRSEVQSWAKGLEDRLAPSTAHSAYRLLATILRAAALDRLIPESPCAGIRRARPRRVEVVPLGVDQVLALVDATPELYRALVVLATGTGLRQGEVFGLRLPRVDFMRRSVTVAEQLVLLPGAPPQFGPPKTKASYRSVPLPTVVGEALAAHLEQFGAATGPDNLVFTTATGGRIRRTRFHSGVWVPALRRAGLPVGTHFHALRHTYASLLIAAGEHPKTIQTRLGHATITETMDTYGHLFPEGEEATRAALDGALGGLRGPSAAQASGEPRSSAR